MSGFDASWLDLREPADHRSRNEELAQAARRATSGTAARPPSWIWAAAPAPTCAPLRRCSAPSSTGRWSTTTRACSTRPSSACPRWADAGRAQEQPARAEQGRQADHGAPAPRRSRPRPRARFQPRSPISSRRRRCSTWARPISSPKSRPRSCAASAAFYTVLTYNGQQRWTPKHEADAAMASAFRAHQTRDKGFGDAAGPMAPALLSATPSTQRAIP